MKSSYNLPCNIAQTLNIIGDKWSLLIIHELAIGHNTYKEIQTGLTGIPTNLLSAVTYMTSSASARWRLWMPPAPL